MNQHRFIADSLRSVLCSGQTKATCLPPYPRDRTATLYSDERRRTRYSVIGVLPVPPSAKLPMAMVGILTA